MSIMCGEIIFHHTPRFFFVLEKCSNPKYNKCSKLTLTQKIEEPLSTRVSACSEASYYYDESHNVLKTMKVLPHVDLIIIRKKKKMIFTM